MYFLGVKKDFSAAHFLRNYNGKCSNLHGHNWVVEAIFRAEDLDECHMGKDFGELRKILDRVLGELDHVFLNEIPQFMEKNPTAENIASYIFYELEEKLSDEKTSVSEVKVWESERAWVSYKH